MTKWQTINPLTIITLLILLSNTYLVLGEGETIQFSEDLGVSWKNVSIVDLNNQEALQPGLENSNKYLFRAKVGNSAWSYVNATTLTDGETTMASLSVTLFLLLLTSSFIAGPFFLRFAKKESANTIWKRMVWTLGIGLLAWTTAIIAEIANNSNIGVGDEMLSFVWIFTKLLYFMMMFVFISIFFTVPRMLREERHNARMGQGNE